MLRVGDSGTEKVAAGAAASSSSAGTSSEAVDARIFVTAGERWVG